MINKITNNSIRDKVQRNFTVVDMIQQRKLQLFGHICRMPDNRLIKTIMLGMVDGDRHRGRPPRRLVDDIVVSNTPCIVTMELLHHFAT